MAPFRRTTALSMTLAGPPTVLAMAISWPREGMRSAALGGCLLFGVALGFWLIETEHPASRAPWRPFAACVLLVFWTASGGLALFGQPDWIGDARWLSTLTCWLVAVAVSYLLVFRGGYRRIKRAVPGGDSREA